MHRKCVKMGKESEFLKKYIGETVWETEYADEETDRNCSDVELQYELDMAIKQSLMSIGFVDTF